MERIKEIKICFNEEIGFPTVEIDGVSQKCIVKLKLDWESQPDEYFKNNFIGGIFRCFIKKPVKTLINQFY